MIKIHHADVFNGLGEIPDGSVDCVVTSPPYWQLRDYGFPGQIGLEPTIAEFVATMARVFTAVKRALKPEGSLWVNLGDTYMSKQPGPQGEGSLGAWMGRQAILIEGSREYCDIIERRIQ